MFVNQMKDYFHIPETAELSVRGAKEAEFCEEALIPLATLDQAAGKIKNVTCNLQFATKLERCTDLKL